MKLRPLEGADAPALRAFRCAKRSGTYAHDTELFIRNQLLLRVRDEGAEARVIVDDRGTMLAVGAFEHRGRDEDLGCDVWYVIVVGVRLDHQGDHIGRDLLEAILTELAERTPGAVAYWMCGEKNAPAQAMSRALNAEPDPVPIGGMRRFYITL